MVTKKEESKLGVEVYLICWCMGELFASWVMCIRMHIIAHVDEVIILLALVPEKETPDYTLSYSRKSRLITIMSLV